MNGTTGNLDRLPECQFDPLSGERPFFTTTTRHLLALPLTRFEQDRSLMRFIEKANVTTLTECWLWRGEVDRLGYGRYRGVIAGGDRFAHRTAYRLWVGGIPQGREVDHLCNVRRCVNPNHLELITHAENQRRAGERRDRCSNGHVRTGRRSDGRRYCMECNRQHQQRWRDQHVDRNVARGNQIYIMVISGGLPGLTGTSLPSTPAELATAVASGDAVPMGGAS